MAKEKKLYTMIKDTYSDYYTCQMWVKDKNGAIRSVSIKTTRERGEKRSAFESRLVNYLIGRYGAPVDHKA